MVSESINNSIFHQLAEQLQQQNLEQFQKQIMEHQQHQQKVLVSNILIYTHTAYLPILDMTTVTQLIGKHLSSKIFNQHC